ncbi:MAG: hypothetical protein R3B06_11790 [Kofleriaceae bacterium]
MLVIYGRRSYGEIDRLGDQYAQTGFAHVYFLPIIPLGTTWVLRDLGDSAQVLPMRVSGRSIAAAYGRTWGTLVGVVGSVATVAGGVSLATLVYGGVTVASLATWRWRTSRGDRRRAAELAQDAIGLGCDPAALTRDAARRLRPGVAERWATIADGRTPEDLITHGGATAEQTAVAFTMLRLIARSEGGAVGKRALADSARLLAATPSTAVGAPYRDQLAP